ncbi:hypothetical protein B0H13DRAFT_2226461 [Mycena leptocephala]|nr:hypothetical protein B0H13DRAFT_2226461 [Mycena leptocephala]
MALGACWNRKCLKMQRIAVLLHFVVITIRALEVYRVTNLRCPCLGIQAFVRALCDIHGVAPRAWLRTQFRVAFDVYLAIRAAVDKRVQVALGRNTPNWRLKNACPACLYKVEGEPELVIPLMVTMDGNNSLSRFETREKGEEFEDGTVAPGASQERDDGRVAVGDYYLPRSEVDKWAKEGLEDLMKSFTTSAENDGGAEGIEVEEEDGCTERWQNMKENVTARARGMYDETGIFPVLCRHGFVLVVVDMIKSGELAKYGFAVTAHLLEVLGRIANGYDIWCKFGKMIKAHPVLSVLAADKRFMALIGAFHGYRHNRRCQLDNLSTYVKGVGLESLKGCETYFSKSNALAETTRYASRFHRQQAITAYMNHTDNFDTYAGLCEWYIFFAFVFSLTAAMRDLSVSSRDEFEQWHAKEKAHLRTHSKEPQQETLEMEYYQKLVNLAEAEYGKRVEAVLGVERPFMPTESDAAYADAAKATRRIEAQRRHALELQPKALAAVQDLEIRLGVATRWVAGDRDWVAASELVRRRRYQRALDNVALQARSKALKNAITRYNEAAEAMSPPKPTLDWEDVVEYAFLSDFDILRNAREPWALPAGRVAMDQHYKLLRADEEIERLNVGIRRFVTYIRDEEAFLSREEGQIREEGDAALAHQVGLLRMERGRFTVAHMERLTKLSKLSGFTGSLSPGVILSREHHVPVVRGHMEPPPPPPANDDDEDEGDVVDGEGIGTDLDHLASITYDEGYGAGA